MSTCLPGGGEDLGETPRWKCTRGLHDMVVHEPQEQCLQPLAASAGEVTANRNLPRSSRSPLPACVSAGFRVPVARAGEQAGGPKPWSGGETAKAWTFAPGTVGADCFPQRPEGPRPRPAATCPGSSPGRPQVPAGS